MQVELARTSVHLGRDAPAESLVRAAIENKRSRLGARHPDLAERLELLGLILNHQQRYAEAVEPLEQAIAIRRESTPHNPGLLIESMNALGRSFTALEEREKAERLLLEAFEMIRLRPERVRPEQIAQTASALVQLYQG